MIFTFTHSNFEDDASLSSTLTVDRAQKRLRVEDDDDRSISTASVSSAFAVKKSVRFNLSDNEEYVNTQICQEDCSELWYSAAEYQSFRAYTRAMSQEIIKAESKNRAPFSHERVLVRAYYVCCAAMVETFASPLSEDDRKHMNRWAEVAPCRLGLEKFTAKQIGRDRHCRRSEIVDIVLDLQQTLEGDDIMEECIRRQSERISLPSRLFARCLADAQAAAL